MDLLRSPAYAVPLVVNLTGSVWFFLLIGKAGEFGGVLFFFISFGGVLGEGDGGGKEGRGRGREDSCLLLSNTSTPADTPSSRHLLQN